MYDKIRIERVKSFPIRSILEAAGKNTKCHREGRKEFYYSPFRNERGPSFCVFPDNKWKDFGDPTGKYSGDAINLVEYLWDEEFIPALLHLERIMAIESPKKSNTGLRKSTDKNNERILKIRDSIQDPSLMKYVASRRIPYPVFNSVALEMTYECHGESYVATAIPVDSGGYSVRGMPTPSKPDGIKRFIGGPSGISTLNSASGNPQMECIVFEGIYNAMSYVTMYGFPLGDIIILNGVGNSKFLAGIGDRGIRTVYCFLDADDSGHKAFTNIFRIANCLVYDNSALYGSLGFNDLNDMLKAMPSV